MKRILPFSILQFLLIIVYISPAHAQWRESGVPVSTSVGLQRQCLMVPDDSSGVIIVWEDRREDYDSLDVYAQRVDADGYVKWTLNGVVVCDAANRQAYARIASDGSGGAIIVWTDNRSGEYDIYAQRLNRNGVPLWSNNGILVCSAQGDQFGPALVSDGDGGAIIAWKDYRDGHDDYYTQRIGSNGAGQWDPDDVPISTVDVGYLAPIGYPYIISDGYGGAIIVWADRRNGPSMVHVQRVDADGNVLWAEDGVAVSDVIIRHVAYWIVQDYFHGAIVTWLTDRDDVVLNDDIYAQRIRFNGDVIWSSTGVPVCVSSEWRKGSPRMEKTVDGGAIITWMDYRDNVDIYAQKVDSLGCTEWDLNGIPICDDINGQGYPRIISDGEDGAVIAWFDSRNFPSDIYIQRINNNGIPYWEANGRALYEAEDYSSHGFIDMAMPDPESIVLTWDEDRKGESSGDIYTKKINLDGTIPVTTLLLSSSTSVDDNSITVRWELAEMDEDISFIISRSENGSWYFQETASQNIYTDGKQYSFTDNTCSYGASYRYRVEYLQDGKHHVLFETSSITIPSIEFELSQNFPNPFNPSTTIGYSVKKQCRVTIEILNVSGRLVRSLSDEILESGRYEAKWDGRDDDGREVDSGIYFCRLKAGKAMISKKMVLIK